MLRQWPLPDIFDRFVVAVSITVFGAQPQVGRERVGRRPGRDIFALIKLHFKLIGVFHKGDKRGFTVLAAVKGVPGVLTPIEPAGQIVAPKLEGGRS